MITATIQDSLARLGVHTDQKPNPKPAQPPESSVRRWGVAAVDQRLEAAAYSETFSLEIVTREGDRVRVDVRQMLAGLRYGETAFAATGDRQGVALVASRAELEAGRFEARFGLHVQGDLNDEEMAALESIFEQVGRLADQFYNGDIQGALAAAQTLRADPTQIGGLNLEMTQSYTRVQAQRQAVSAYVAVERDTRPGPWPPQAAVQVERYWAQVEQVQVMIEQTFRSFSLSIEFMMGGGDQREVSAIEQVHEQIREAVGELRQLLGLENEPETAQQPEGKDDSPRPEAAAEAAETEGDEGSEGATVAAAQQQADRPDAVADTPRNQVEAVA